MNDDPMPALPTVPAEQWALELAAPLGGATILCASLGRGQAAAALAADRPTAQVTLWFLDLYRLQLAQTQLPSLPTLSLVCSSDFPDQPFDLIVLPLSHRGEAELARDLIQTAFERLVIGGHLVVTVDHPRDKWVHEQLRALGCKVTVASGAQAAGYVICKRSEPKRLRSLQASFTFRDGDHVLQAVSRPGVFAHRRLDPGARQLIDAMDWPSATATANDTPLQILEIGCGSGTISAAIAARAARAQIAVQLHAIDSCARAVQCTGLTAAANGLSGITAVLDCDGRSITPGGYQLAIANPPYYADFRIARLFINIARQALAAGGTLYLVTKHPDWYHQNLFPGWRDTEIWPQGQYHIVRARRG